MNSNIDTHGRTTQPSGLSSYLSAHVFAMGFTSTARGARLARRLAAVRLEEWGVPYGTGPHEAVVLVVAELAANAVRHGHVSGRDFQLLLRMTAEDRPTVRVEVSDTRGERVPPRPGELPVPAPGSGLAGGGRGLLLVEGIADRWGWHPRPHAPGKTVWAECGLPGPSAAP
ncbi:ATP-binding protein [Streptomyces sp. NPDC002476]|uniref:ATP-binding protein n=1 Tax=Streptomyces sp. NPDC002476 TaxID=3364648 RepID=UPI00367B59D7